MAIIIPNQEIPKIVIQGGIELNNNRNKKKIQETLDEICKEAYSILLKKTSVDAVEYAIMMLEDDPMFNAGTGSLMQSDGKIRMDASIMDGYNLKSGAVAQIQDIRNPIEVARKIMDDTKYCLIVGEEAQNFAFKSGISKYPHSIKDVELINLKIKDSENDIPHGTVGCVAIDEKERICAGTSTGGWETCIPGRVGDVPVIGAGTYANSNIGISCTEHGEKILNLSLARLVSLYQFLNPFVLRTSLFDTTELAMNAFKQINGVGGLIAIDFKGYHSIITTNQEFMPVSYMPK